MPKETVKREAKLTYFSNKKTIVCPACGTEVLKEEILSGSGRLIAGELTDELHRTYEKTQKFGYVYPLIYSVTVCPECLFAALPNDFDEPLKEEVLQKVNKEVKVRRNMVQKLFPTLNFREVRTLYEGIASYILAVLCYDLFTAEQSPTFKMGLCALRGAWLAKDAHLQELEEHFDYLSLVLARKASFYYRRAVELEEQAVEYFSTMGNLGPDQDNNFGFEGALYLSGVLEFKYGSRNNKDKRIKSLNQAKTAISKIVGLGRANKGKPTAILELARQVYEQLKVEQTELENQIA